MSTGKSFGIILKKTFFFLMENNKRTQNQREQTPQSISSLPAIAIIPLWPHFFNRSSNYCPTPSLDYFEAN